MNTLPYLQGYPESLLSQVTALIEQDRLGEVLQKRYPQGHDVNSDKALYQYTQDLKAPLSARGGADQQSDVRQ
ncbi:putative metal-dependent hydrolase [Klebsiella variicola]|nr:putative metal-dependent hydrolase [Klebsiella variicola]